MFKGYAEDIASKSGTTVDIPADVLETANAEILVSLTRRSFSEQLRSLLKFFFCSCFQALRKRSGNDESDVSGFEKKISLA